MNIKILISISILFASQFSLANAFKQALKDLEALNNGVSANQCLANPNEDRDLMELCVVKLCGPSEKLNSGYITNDKVNNLIKGTNAQRFLTEVKPSLKAIIKSYVSINNELISSLVKSLKETGLDEANQWNESDYRMLATELFAPYINITTKDGVKKVKANLPASFSTELKNASEDYATNKNFTCGPECQKGVLNYLKQIDFESELKTFANKNDIESLVSARSSSVLAHYTAASMKPNGNNLQPITANADKKMVSFIASTFSEQSSLKFKAYIKDIYVHEPRTGSNFQELKAKYIRTIDQENAYVSAKNLKDQTKLQLLRRYLEFRNGAPQDIDPLKDFDYWAEAPGYINDHFAPAGISMPGMPVFNKDTINISPFVCTNHRPGEGVILHELGHALSYAFKHNKLNAKDLEKYQKIRKCVQNSYNFSQTKPDAENQFIHPGDFQNTEEDMADLISFSIRKNDPFISSCALLNTTFDKKKYLDISLSGSSYDTHSTPFLRVLKEAISKQNFIIPNECKSVIESNKEDYNFASCL